MDIDNITGINSSIMNRKIIHTPTSSHFFMLLVEKSPEIFPKHKESLIISESFALNCYIFVVLINNKLFLPLQCRLKHNFLFDLKKLFEC